MSKKLITLTPLGAYYFGGERSLPLGEKDENELASYIVESELFPQQTSLLGMLRFLILKGAGPTVFHNGRIQDTEKARLLIGETGFNTDAVGSACFGNILSLDFCFLQQVKDEQCLNILPAPFDYELGVQFGKEKAYCNGIEKFLPEIEKYSAKKGLTSGYLNINNNTTLNEKDIFVKDQRIGINRDISTGKTENKALFKQGLYRLQEGFRFAFIIRLKEGYQLPAHALVELGGESSKFLLEVHDIPEDTRIEYPAELFQKQGDMYKLVLLSDSYICNKKVDDFTDFSITSHRPFKFLQFNIQDVNYRNSKDNNKKGKRYSLFAKRSVFYFENDAKVKSFLTGLNNSVFQQIGYNKYQISK